MVEPPKQTQKNKQITLKPLLQVNNLKQLHQYIHSLIHNQQINLHKLNQLNNQMTPIILTKSITIFALCLILTNTLDIVNTQNPIFNQNQQLNTQQSNQYQIDNQRIYQSDIKSLSMRLTPNQDIITQITQLLTQSKHHNKYRALSIISAVGSVNYCWIRFANQSTLTKIKGPMEIVSLSGTFDLNLSPHVHISVSRGTGQTLGGHLPSLQQRQQAIRNQPEQEETGPVLYDCPIFTTLQLALLSHQDIIYRRKIDSVTTFNELTIQKKHFYSK